MTNHQRMRDFRDLKVWRKSHDLTLAVYKATAGFPRDELHGFTGQIRRSCSSIPTNVAEGCGRSRTGPLLASSGRFCQRTRIPFAARPRSPLARSSRTRGSRTGDDRDKAYAHDPHPASEIRSTRAEKLMAES